MKDIRSEAVTAFKMRNVPDAEAMRLAALDRLKEEVMDHDNVAIGDVLFDKTGGDAPGIAAPAGLHTGLVERHASDGRHRRQLLDAVRLQPVGRLPIQQLSRSSRKPECYSLSTPLAIAISSMFFVCKNPRSQAEQ